ncbi:MAG TPA: hypothetical protein VMW10_06365, partial [Alphaproteobacteria bacterium]|nr:hypothetical protein [Alphaproteobacteria bacterium]
RKLPRLTTPGEEFPDLTPPAQKQLQQIATYDIEEKFTPMQWGLIVLGGVTLGAWFTFAMWPVYDGGLVYVEDNYGWGSWVKDIENKEPAQNPVLYYIFATVLPDALVNTTRWSKRIIASLAKGGIEWRKVISSGTASILPSLVEFSYLVGFELYAMKKSGTHGLNNQFSIATFTLSPALLIYHLCSNTEMFLGMEDDIKNGIKATNDWLRTSNSLLAKGMRRVLHLPPVLTEDLVLLMPTEEREKREMQKKFDTFIAEFPNLHQDERKTIFETLFNSKKTINDTFPDFSEEERKTAHSFFVTRYLLSLGDLLQNSKKKVTSWLETITTGGCIALGSPARFLVLEFVVEQFFGLFCPKLVSKVFGWVGATIGFPFQSYLEYKAMKNFFNKYIWSDPSDGHSSHPNLRTTAKGAAFVQGCMMTAPLAVLCLEVAAMWFESSWWMIAAIPFLAAEFTTQATSYNKSYNQGIITAGADLHNQFTRKVLGKESREDYQLDWVIRLVQRVREEIIHLSPKAMKTLKESTEVKIEEDYIL